MKTVDEVGLPIQVFPSMFSPVLQHVAWHCHVVKSLCCVSACIAAVFSSMSNASIVVDSNLPWWFQSIWAVHDKLHPADPTKCRAKSLNHGYWALPPMSVHDQAYPTILYAHSYHSVSTFHRWLWYNAKNTKLSFSAIEVAVPTWQDAIQCPLALTRTAPNVLAFESFLMLSNISELLCEQLLMILQVQLAPDMSLHEVMPPIVIFKLFWCTRAFFIFNIKIITLEASKLISSYCFQQSMITVSLNKNSVRFSYRFLLNNVVQ